MVEKPRRRWFQFSLRHFMLEIGLAGLAIGLWLAIPKKGPDWISFTVFGLALLATGAFFGGLIRRPASGAIAFLILGAGFVWWAIYTWGIF